MSGAMMPGNESPSTHQTFTYPPLGEREFRLLELLPLPDSPNLPLRCQLKNISLDRYEELMYEAISYCWGDPTPSSVIQIGATKVFLLVNSEKALRRFALPDKSRTVFIDAVCINQADLAERSVQVTLMGDIFRYAQSTLVYLGEADETTARAFANIRDLHLEFQQDAEANGGLVSLLNKRAQNRPKTPLDTEVLNRLYRRDWFDRVWVVQEVAIATRSIVVCGPHQADMLTILEVAAWLSSYHMTNTPHKLWSVLLNAAEIWSAQYSHTRGLSILQQLLTANRRLKATDSRDRVFGMLGLLPLATVVGPGYGWLDVDYTKPFPAVFRDAVKHHTFTDGLWILEETDHRDEADLMVSGYPSWVPKFDRPFDPSIDATRLVILDYPWSNSAEVPPWIERKCWFKHDEPSILNLHGLQLGHVLAASASLVPDESGYDQFMSDLDSWIRIAVLMTQSYGIPENTIARTLVAARDHQGYTCTEDFLYGLPALLLHLQEKVEVPTVPQIVNEVWVPRADDSGDIDNDSIVQASYYRQAMVISCRHRKLAVMSNGTTALVPKLTEPLDRVITMPGLHRQPFVVRPYENDYLFLGSCYVDGWMPWQEHAAELEQRAKDESPNFETFRIR